QKLTRLRYPVCLTDNLNLVGSFACLLVDRNAIDEVDQGAKKGVPGKDKSCEQRRLSQQICSGEGANCGRAPEGGRGVQATNVHAFFHDDSGAKESDPRPHVGHNLRRTIVSVKSHAEVYESCCPYANQNVGA